MEKEIKVKAVCKYNGHNVKPNKSIDLNLKFAYDELANCIKTLQLLNENITVFAKIEDNKPKKLGLFMLWEHKVTHDGEVAIKLNSQVDYVENGILDTLAGVDRFVLLLKANVDVETEDDEE